MGRAWSLSAPPAKTNPAFSSDPIGAPPPRGLLCGRAPGYWPEGLEDTGARGEEPDPPPRGSHTKPSSPGATFLLIQGGGGSSVGPGEGLKNNVGQDVEPEPASSQSRSSTPCRRPALGSRCALSRHHAKPRI